MKYQTLEQLSEMKLNPMKLEYQRQMELPSSMEQPFDERFGSIVNRQYTARKEAKIKRLIKAATLRESFACLEHLDYDPVRNLKKTSVAQLSDCEWIRKGSNLIVCGATGVGKTYLLSAFGREACMKGLTVKSFRVTRLLTDLSIGRGDGSYNKLMQDLVKPDLLILDDFGMKQLDLQLTQDLLEVIEDRYHRQKSVAISAQLPVKEWISIFTDPTIADAVLDRIVRNAYRFDLRGPSRRPTIHHYPEGGDDKH
jgi:DNA replication protein DnaC